MSSFTINHNKMTASRKSFATGKTIYGLIDRDSHKGKFYFGLFTS